MASTDISGSGVRPPPPKKRREVAREKRAASDDDAATIDYAPSPKRRRVEKKPEAPKAKPKLGRFASSVAARRAEEKKGTTVEGVVLPVRSVRRTIKKKKE
jgi:hypothetical protein